MQSRRSSLKYLGAIACALPVKPSPAQSPERRRKIRVGQIGVGHAHASKLSVYRASDEYEVVGIVEPNAELRAIAEGKSPYQDLHWMTTEQLLNVPELELVLVETQVQDLLGTAQTCIDAGKHIHLDKPAGDSLPAFRRLLGDAERSGLAVQLGYMYRYNPAILLLREFLSQGWLGEVFEVHAVMSKVVDAASRRQLAEFPGGMMFELGCHLIDLVVGLLGAPDRVTPFTRHSATHADELQDNMLAVLEYPHSLASIKTTALEVEGFARRHLVVCGSGGTFHIQPLDNPAARIALAQPSGGYRAGYQDVEFPKFQRYIADAADMAQVIRGEKANDFTYAHDLDVQTTVLRASGLI